MTRRDPRVTSLGVNKNLENRGVPDDRPIARFVRRISFYQTDAMGIVHHANYAHLLEDSRIRYLEQHDMGYADYVSLGFHFAVTRLDIRYRRAARFDEEVETLVWLEWGRGAAIGIGYELRCGGDVVASAATEHALVDESGKAVRLPLERRNHLRTLVGRPDS